jgi:hypothetical protein
MFSNHAAKDYLSIDFEGNIFLVFGYESVDCQHPSLISKKNRLFKIAIHWRN